MTNLLSRDGTTCLESEALLDGRYRLVQVLSTEPWGQIYLAQDTRRPSQPQCIIQHIKPITVEPEYQDAIRHLFVREAAILETLADHDQIPKLLACFEDEQGFYLVHEFVTGYPLSLELHSGQNWGENEVIQLLIDCLEPLAYVHNQGIRHGNLEPENLVRRVEDGKFVLVGFDSVRQLHLSLLSLHGYTVSTTPNDDPGYQAPEQLEGMPCLASDVYAIGMIAIQALTGTHPSFLPTNPVTGESFWQLLPKSSESSLREKLLAILKQMVKHDHNQRYASAGEALEAVQQLQMASLKSADSHSVPVVLEGSALEHSAVESSALEPNVIGHGSLEQSVVESDIIETNVVEPDSVPYPVGEAEIIQNHPQTRRLSSLEGNGMTLAVGLGIGTVVTATTVGYVFLMNPPDLTDQGPQILEQARNQYQQGKLPQAVSLAESIPITSQAHNSAQDEIKNWRKDWREATSTYQKMVDALKQEKWQEVLDKAKTLPQTAYWKERTADLVEKANRIAENGATQLMVKAYSSAIARDFSSALAVLKQIPETTTLYTQAQEKIKEYTEKRQIQAVALLQEAYNRAIVRDFDGALAYLKQISSETTVYAKAQKKIEEYTQKQKIRAQALLQAANNQAASNNYLAALTSLEKVPTGTSFDSEIQEKTSQYTDKMYVWSDSLLQQANQQANNRDYSSALATLKKIPLGTPSYGEAREKIQEYARLQQQPEAALQSSEETALASDVDSESGVRSVAFYSPTIRTAPSIQTQELNPGGYLREANAQ